MSRYRRVRVSGGTYFFTVNLLERKRTLLMDRIIDLREAVGFVKQKYPFKIDAWVVLPDHMHAVWTLPEGDFDYSSRWREIKKRLCLKIPKNEYRSQNRKQRNERGIWQRRFWEHTILSDQDYRLYIDYIHLNPLKHKLVSHVRDWPFSSFHGYVEKGLYAENWCG